MTLRLLLVRHGLSTFNKDRRVQGRNDLSTLTNEGKEQATQTGDALAELPIDFVYSSPLQRAVETTKNILKQHQRELNPIYTDDLLEIDLGPWSGLTKDEIKSQYPNEFITWEKQPKELVIQREDGTRYKPIANLMLQAKHFLDKLINQDTSTKNTTILLVGHNAIIRCLLLNLLGDPEQGFRRIQIDNASISIINIKSQINSYNLQIECLNNTTHLTTTLPNKKNNKRLILVRHGETNWNQEGRFQGQINIPLNKNGQSQALSAAQFLKNVDFDKAFTSSMSRPRETAEIILKSHQGIMLDEKEELIEIGHGLWEGKLEAEIKENWSDLLKRWQTQPETVQMPEGENLQEVWTRAVNCWENICKELDSKQTALVVAHDAVNKTILCHLLGLSSSDIWMIKQGNGGVSVIDIPEDPNQLNIVVCLNLTSHLGGILDKTATGAL